MINPTGRINKAVLRIIAEQKKNKKKYQQNDSNIYLGRMFTLGNLFTYFLAEELFKNTNYKILVDCPIKLPSKQQCIYPDITIIRLNGKKQVLKGVIEVKLDAGFLKPTYFGFKKKVNTFTYNRSKNSFRKLYNNMSKHPSFTYYIKDKHYEKEQHLVKIPKRFRKVVLLLHETNAHRRLDGLEYSVKDAGFKYISILKESDIRRPPKDLKVVKKDIYRQKKKIERVFKSF